MVCGWQGFCSIDQPFTKLPYILHSQKIYRGNHPQNNSPEHKKALYFHLLLYYNTLIIKKKGGESFMGVRRRRKSIERLRREANERRFRVKIGDPLHESFYDKDGEVDYALVRKECMPYRGELDNHPRPKWPKPRW